MKIFKLVKLIRNRIMQTTNPVGWARRIGVNFPWGQVYLYGRISWSTEPWIITLGNNVHITEGVKFLTHDGGTLLYRNRVPDLEITKPIVVGASSAKKSSRPAITQGIPSRRRHFSTRSACRWVRYKTAMSEKLRGGASSAWENPASLSSISMPPTMRLISLAM